MPQCGDNQMEGSDSRRSAYLIKNIHERQRILALQGQCSVHNLSGCLGGNIWEFPRSYVNRHELGEEIILER